MNILIAVSKSLGMRLSGVKIINSIDKRLLYSSKFVLILTDYSSSIDNLRFSNQLFKNSFLCLLNCYF